MLYLFLGLVLWSTLHLLPARAPALRQKAVSAIGLWPYKGLFALLTLGCFVLIVQGWQATPATPLWIPPVGLRHLTLLLMIPAVIFVVAAYVPGNLIQAKLGHPMLMGVGTWGLAHLLANGEMRSVLLFGTFLIWSFMDIKAIKARDGAAKPPAAANAGLRTAIVVLLGLVIYAALIVGHPHFAGRAVIAV